MKLSIRFLTFIILLGGIIGGISVGPASILSAFQKGTPQYEKKYDYNGHWAEMYIDRAIAEGIVKGYPDGSFKPDEFISRAGFAVMLDKIIKAQNDAKDESLLTGYNDYNEVPEWAKSGLRKAIDLGYLKGYSDNTIRPMAPLKRQDITELISKEKLPSKVFKQKNNTFVTRAEACVIVLSIQDNGLLKKTVSNDLAEVSVKPLPVQKEPESLNVPVPVLSSSVHVRTPALSSGKHAPAPSPGSIKKTDRVLPDNNTTNEQSTSAGEEQSGTNTGPGANPSETVTPQTGNLPTLPDTTPDEGDEKQR